MTQSGCVVQVTVEVDESDGGRTVTGPGRHRRQSLEVVLDESRLEHQILRGVAGDRQLGEHRQIGSGLLGVAQQLDHLRHVAIEVAHRRVDLREV